MPANRMALLQRCTLEGFVAISVSMLDRLCNRVEFLRAFTESNTVSKRQSGAESGRKPPAASFRYPGEQERAIRK
jgi:hypothetical protein